LTNLFEERITLANQKGVGNHAKKKSQRQVRGNKNTVRKKK